MESYSKNDDAHHLDTQRQALSLVGSTGKARELMEEHGNLRGHPVWMGIGVNGIYDNETVLAHIEWALQHQAGTFWLVLAHELVAENKLAYKSGSYHEARETPEPDAEYIEIDTAFGRRKITLSDEERYAKTAERAKHIRTISEYRDLALERKTTLREKTFRELRPTQSTRVVIATIEEMYNHVLQNREGGLKAQMNLYSQSLMLDPIFRADMEKLFSKVVPNFHAQMQAGKVHMPSAYNYTLNQIFLTYFLNNHGIGIKVGPKTEMEPDAIYQNFVDGMYNTKIRNTQNQGNQGFLYLK